MPEGEQAFGGDPKIVRVPKRQRPEPVVFQSIDGWVTVFNDPRTNGEKGPGNAAPNHK